MWGKEKGWLQWVKSEAGFQILTLSRELVRRVLDNVGNGKVESWGERVWLADLSCLA